MPRGPGAPAVWVALSLLLFLSAVVVHATTPAPKSGSESRRTEATRSPSEAADSPPSADESVDGSSTTASTSTSTSNATAPTSPSPADRVDDSGGPRDPSTIDTPSTSTNPDGPASNATAFASEIERAVLDGVPAAAGVLVIASSCHGETNRAHWGYYNNGATGGTVVEPDGAAVPLGAICLNPNQPDVRSGLLHELGHKWFWDTGRWDESAATFGSTERAAECFARHFGATVFGAGGCPDRTLELMALMM